jgi:hypothetical protein
VVCGGVFLFLMLFMGKLALYDGAFLGFFAFVYFSMYNFIKSQAFICVENCIFFFLCSGVFFLRFVRVLFIIIAR